MPTYQYRCAKCSEQFEVWQSIHDDALTTHDGDCHGSLAKVLAVGGIVLKGPGFYRNDSRASSGNREGRGKDGKDGKEKESAGSNGNGDKASGSGASEKKDSKQPESKASPSKSDAAKT
jgi:putative FmdB family regulatory protein